MKCIMNSWQREVGRAFSFVSTFRDKGMSYQLCYYCVLSNHISWFMNEHVAIHAFFQERFYWILTNTYIYCIELFWFNRYSVPEPQCHSIIMTLIAKNIKADTSVRDKHFVVMERSLNDDKDLVKAHLPSSLKIYCSSRLSVFC